MSAARQCLGCVGTSSAVAFDRVYPFQNGYLTYFVRLTNQISRQNPTGQALVDFIYRSDVHRALRSRPA